MVSKVMTSSGSVVKKDLCKYLVNLHLPMTP
jgi:hypothetical protein